MGVKHNLDVNQNPGGALNEVIYREVPPQGPGPISSFRTH